MSLSRDPKTLDRSEFETPDRKGLVTGDPSSESAQIAALAQLIVQTLNIETEASQIDPDESLYGEGLGLDSIDILEIALIVSQTYGVNLRSDDENNVNIFKSLRNLNEYIQQRRTK